MSSTNLSSRPSLRIEGGADTLDRVFPCPTHQLAKKEVQSYLQGDAVNHQPALTEREEKVRRILLKELDGMNPTGVRGLRRLEKERLHQTLDVGYLDREIARMDKRLGQMKRWLPWTAVGLTFYLMASNISQISHGSPWWTLLMQSVSVVAAVSLMLFNIRAIRRRLCIFEALRTLSDADEMDVVLDRATLDTDRLISEITHRAFAIESEAKRSFR